MEGENVFYRITQDYACVVDYFTDKALPGYEDICRYEIVEISEDGFTEDYLDTTYKTEMHGDGEKVDFTIAEALCEDYAVQLTNGYTYDDYDTLDEAKEAFAILTK